MKARIEQFLLSLLSRKFLITIVGAYFLYQLKRYDEMVLLVLGFLGVEGGADIVSRYKSRSLVASDVLNSMSQNDETGVDTNKVITGKTPLFNEEEQE